MRILLLGSGGREHALALKLSESPLCENLFIAPGNAGTELCGINLNFTVTDFDSIRKCCIEEKIDMVVVGPEEPLVKGITDFLINDPVLKHLDVIGPTAAAARLEGSKAFAKAFMERHDIPTASYREFTLENYQEGVNYLRAHTLPIVLKADGLAAGKGVVICENYVEANAEFELMIQRAKFGEASRKVVVEEFLDGIEISVFVLFDGESYIILPSAKDYKRVGEKDTGPNTGGMGAISPVPFADSSFMKEVEEKVIRPTVNGLISEGLEYRGFIFFGLMKVDNEPYVIEYNCRMGDPETQVVIPRIQNDLVELFKATASRDLKNVKLKVDDRHACVTVAVSGGYPNEYEKGHEILGTEEVTDQNTIVYFAGSATRDSRKVTNGGRVVCVTSFGDSIREACERSRLQIEKITFVGMSFRKDIGYEFA